jgi:hypothetical protein
VKTKKKFEDKEVHSRFVRYGRPTASKHLVYKTMNSPSDHGTQTNGLARATVWQSSPHHKKLG